MSEYNINKFEYKNNIYKFMDYRLSGLMTVEGTQSSSTNNWLGNIQVSDLENGMTIVYYLPFSSTSSNATLNLALEDGTTTGPVEVYDFNNSRFNYPLDAGSMIILTYWKALSISIDGISISSDRWIRSDFEYISKYIKYNQNTLNIKIPDSNYSIKTSSNGVMISDINGQDAFKVQNTEAIVNKISVNEDLNLNGANGRWVQYVDSSNRLKIDWEVN